MTPRPSPVMAIVVALATLAFAGSVLIVPGFGGFDPQQFPIPQDDPPVQPAGYAFAIWGVIYLWLLAAAAYGLIARAQEVDWAEMRPPLALSLAIGAAWLPVAELSPLGATVLIWAMLVPALVALRAAPRLDRWWARAPVALYAGWLTAASCVSIGLILAGYLGANQGTAAILSLVLALAIAAFILSRVSDIAEYGIAVVWAVIAIAVQNWGGDMSVFWLALAGAALIGALTLRNARR